MNDYRPPYRSAVLAGVGILAVYVLTLAPSTAMWDTSEYIATAHILGIPHPPGNPLFVVLARAWSLLLAPLGFPVAVRINLLAAFTSAGAAAFYFLVVHRILWGILPTSGQMGLGEKRRPASAGERSKGIGTGPEEGDAVPGAEPSRRWISLTGAFLAVLLSGTAFTVWNQSNVNEKVYTVSVFIIAAVIWMAFRWRDRRDHPAGERYLLAAVYLLALGSTNHLMSVLPVPALGLFVLMVAPGALLKKTLWIRAIPLVVLGLSVNLFLPIRAARDPVINEGDPTCESLTSAAVAIYSNGKAGCHNLSRVLTRFQYRKPPLTERQAPIGAQLENYYQYFEWQWGRGLDPAPQPGGARMPVALLFLALGLLGLWALWKGDRGAFYLLGGLALTVTFGLVFYLNFKYGYSLAPNIQDAELHEVRERDYFFIVSFGLWGVLAALGLTRVWHRLAGELKNRRALLFTAPVLLVALIPAVANWKWASRSGDFATRDWAYDLLMSVEPYGVIFTNGDNDTFPLWYVQEVEGIRQDVTVVVGQYLYTPWYPRQLKELTSPGRQRLYDPEVAGDLYPVPDLPEGPIVSLAPEEMDAIQGGRTSEDMNLPLGDIAVQYPGGTYLDRGDQLTLAMIISSMGERPIYFATPSGILGRLGLEPWTVRHGLAAKLLPRDLDGPQPPDVIQTSSAVGGDWFDVRRSLTLLQDVYSYRGLENREVWADRSTLNIPWYFYATSVQVADAVSQWEEGTEEAVNWLGDKADAFSVTAQGGRLALPPAPAEGG